MENIFTYFLFPEIIRQHFKDGILKIEKKAKMTVPNY